MTSVTIEERAAAVLVLRQVRAEGTARLLRGNVLTVTAPEGWDGRRIVCGLCLTASPYGLSTPDRAVAHAFEEHGHVEPCCVCEADIAVETRSARILIAGPPLIGRRPSGDPVMVAGVFDVDPWARLCTACAALWPRDAVDVVEIR
jgi:hypothetical protein